MSTVELDTFETGRFGNASTMFPIIDCLVDFRERHGFGSAEEGLNG